MKRIFCLAVFAVAGSVAAPAVLAQDQPAYPNKSIRYIIPYAVGGGTDILGRIVAQRLGERISGLGAYVKGGTFGEFIRKELRLWERVVKQANLRAD